MKIFKTLLKALYVCLSLLAFTTSCEKENLENGQQGVHHHGVTTERIDFVNAKHYQGLRAQVEGLLNNIAEAATLAKTSQPDIEIILEDVLYSEYSGTHTYTFKAVRQEPEVFIENLVLHYNLDTQSYDQYLIEYHVSEQEYLAIANGAALSGDEKIVITPVDSNLNPSSIGVESCRTVVVNCSQNEHHAGNIDDWYKCTAAIGPQLNTICTADPVDWVEPGTGNPGGPGTGGPSGPGGGVVVTNPNATTPCSPSDGSVGITGSNGCVATADSIARDNLFNALQGYMTSQAQADYIVFQADIEVVKAMNALIVNGLSVPEMFQIKSNLADLIDVLREERRVDMAALNFVLEAVKQNKGNVAVDQALLDAACCVNPLILTTLPADLVRDRFNLQCAFLKRQHPTWKPWKIYYYASKDLVHIGLDVFGLMPVIGEPADLVNAVLYLVEGDGVNATISAAALIPFAGWGPTAGKYMFKLIPKPTGGKTAMVWKVLSNGYIDFGSRNQLRAVMGLTDSAIHAHHVIPFELERLDVVQKAAQAYPNPFHFNEAINGMPRPQSLHLTGHNRYNDKIRDILERWNADYPNASIDRCNTFITNLQNHIITHMNNNRNLNSGQIADLINFY